MKRFYAKPATVASQSNFESYLSVVVRLDSHLFVS
jgi:hypothetical protein